MDFREPARKCRLFSVWPTMRSEWQCGLHGREFRMRPPRSAFHRGSMILQPPFVAGAIALGVLFGCLFGARLGGNLFGLVGSLAGLLVGGVAGFFAGLLGIIALSAIFNLLLWPLDAWGRKYRPPPPCGCGKCSCPEMSCESTPTATRAKWEVSPVSHRCPCGILHVSAGDGRFMQIADNGDAVPCLRRSGRRWVPDSEPPPTRHPNPADSKPACDPPSRGI